MTPEMISKARKNQAKGGYDQVEFRLGEIENLPVADASADVIISNGVINLSPDKPRVFREALVWTEYEGLTQPTLAQRLGISLSGAQSRLQRGRARLKEMLNRCCTFEFDRRGKVIDCEPRSKSGCENCIPGLAVAKWRKRVIILINAYPGCETLD